MVLSSWHSHCESSPGSLDECSLSANYLPYLTPSQLTWGLAADINNHHRHLLLLLSPNADTQFISPQRVEG